MILSAQSILKRKIITPCVPRTVVYGKTHGISAAGYVVRVDFHGLGYSTRILGEQPARCPEHTNYALGPKDGLLDAGFFLAATMEHFDMPDDVMGIVHDKSSWARNGVAVQNTVIEPGWRGYLTLEITYHGPVGRMVQITHGDPIAQIVFHQLDEPTVFPYTGKYQDQEQGAQEARSENSS